jgi:hypothetical protein
MVVHLAILELACHAGGRGFESRRSRKNPCKSAYCVVCAEIGPDYTDFFAARPETVEKRPEIAAGWRFQPDLGRVQFDQRSPV